MLNIENLKRNLRKRKISEKMLALIEADREKQREGLACSGGCCGTSGCSACAGGAGDTCVGTA